MVVHRIFSGCTKAEHRLLQPGDSLLCAGDVESSDGRWNSDALAALLPALMDDSSLGCVMERPRRPPSRREGYIWYSQGVSGEASSDAVAFGTLADHSVLVIHQQGEPRRPGRQLFVSYHRMRRGEVRWSDSYAVLLPWCMATQLTRVHGLGYCQCGRPCPIHPDSHTPAGADAHAGSLEHAACRHVSAQA